MMRSHEVVASTVTPHLVKLLSRVFGIDRKTVEAWRRPKESDADPTGTGKGNPLDRPAQAMKIIHEFDPAGARRWAQYLVDVCDELDKARTASGFESIEDKHERAARLLRESSEAVIALVRNDDDAEALREVEEMIEVGNELANCLRAEIGMKVR